MSDLGQLLKKARLDQSISLDQLEEMTKIRKRYLEAIEDGDYKILPGSFYVRAFIKSYSEAVGLDPNEVLGLYGNAIPAPVAETVAEPIRRRKRDSRSTEKLSKWASNILMLSFILLILGILYYFIGNSYSGDQGKQIDPNDKITEKRSDQQSAAGTNAPGIKTDTVNPQQNGQAVTPPPKTPVVTLARTENNIDYYTVTNADTLNVQLTIGGDECWLKIDRIVPATADRKAERQEIEQKLYKKGDTRDWTTDAGFFIRVGFPPAAQIVVNGTAIQLGSGKSVKQVQIDLQKST
ncbi:helix-turn-helix domain-containing protein [Paenibacillus hodogayensis]|uniref:Helix-turn-helix domain-containing protein n=1 Tax=Paenibacillus hodogayensis TaxID=279208 RepID=A0ABV5W2D1_9BACL